MKGSKDPHLFQRLANFTVAFLLFSSFQIQSLVFISAYGFKLGSVALNNLCNVNMKFKCLQ